jgi:HlyD family secretion protein
MRALPRRLSAVAALLLSIGAASYLYGWNRRPEVQYRTARAERGVVTAVVSATGTLNPVTTVQVGSQVSGQIAALFVDFNSAVAKDQVIARIDPATFEAKVEQAAAQLAATQATVLHQRAAVRRAQADLDQARATVAIADAQIARAKVVLLDAQRDLGRKKQLFSGDLIARSDRDTAEATHDAAGAQLAAAEAQRQANASALASAEAQVAVSNAQLAAAVANVTQSQAALQQAKVDLERTTIRAPVSGVVVSRNVDVGQTVAASLQAPTLFTIAEDLTKMQVETNVDEADVGRVQAKQSARFTVDSFPGETFNGEVVQIRKAAQVLQNVVTYVVVVAVDNPRLKLMPGMTSSVKIVVDHKDRALKIPLAALRVAEDNAHPPAIPRTGNPQRAGALRHPAATTAAGVPTRAPGEANVWALPRTGTPELRSVRLGASDGEFAEVAAGDLAEGDQIVVEIVRPARR